MSFPIERLETRRLLASAFTISEFMADNSATLKDEDGIASDWIEIHNTSQTAQSLAGFHLTDSATDLTEWTFPDVSIAPNGYLVVFASGKNRTNVASNLHTNFSLNAGGEYLALVEPDGTTKDSEFAFGQQETDISYGLDPASGKYRFFATPTPGSANQRAEVVINEIHYQPDIKTQLVEFIELYNPGSAPVDLSGASFASGIAYTFPNGSILAPGKYIVITQNMAQFQAKFQCAAFGQFTGKLSNEGDDLVLRNASGGKLDEVDYQGNFPWPTVGDTPGYSIQLINPDFDNSVGGNWRSAAPSVLSTPLSNVALFGDHSTWDYRKGNSEASNPTSLWKQVNFTEDSTWFKNQAAPVGYDPSVVMGSKLTDMRGNYASVFMRKTFTVTDPSQFSALKLDALYDDGFNLWINGVHVLKSPEMTSDDPAYNVTVSDDTPNGSARENNNYVTFTLNNPSSYLVAGTNVIAVHFHNTQLSNSSDAFFDARLSAIPAGANMAGSLNTVYATNAAPQMRQVSNSPQAPLANQAVTVTAKVTDPEGVASVNLLYQLVDPGNYIAIEDASYSNPANWTTLTMRDDGQGGDATAGDNIYTAIIPASAQVNRRLVRYRITATDALGASITAPYADDPVPNFAYYVYNGVPSWSGALQPGAGGTNGQVLSFSSATLGSVPVIQLLTKKIDHDNSQYIPGATQGQYGGSSYLWSGTLVYNGVVYDNIHYRARGGVWRYSMGKNMWKFDFQTGHEFQMYYPDGTPYPTRWKKMNFGANIQQGDIGDRGEQGLFETLSFGLFNKAGVPAEATIPVSFRIVENASETGATQYDTDFQGLYMAIEQPDGRFLDAHGLPDGNLYKMEGGTGPGGGTLNNQGPTQPSDNSDLVSFANGLNSSATDQWIRDNVDLQEFYSYKAIVEMIHHWDIGFSKNYYFYHNPDTNKWQVIPWDTDLTWYVDYEPGGGDGTPLDFILSRPAFAIEYRNRVRELQDLLYSTGEVAKMADAYAALVNPSGGGPTIIQADAAMWDYNPIMTSGYVNSSKAGAGRYYQKSAFSKDFAGMVATLKSWQANRENYISGTVLTTTDENAAPRSAGITYTGPAGFPLDKLTFATSSFAPGNSGGSFAGMEWRIADVTPVSVTQPRYEIDAAWDSGVLTSFSPAVEIPPTAVTAGHTYRLRIRMKDSNGRWSHWSNPYTFVPSAAQSAVLDSLRITELDYNPSAPPAGSTYTKEDFEFVELRNMGNAAINLQGAQFTNGISFTFGDLLLGPGQSCVVVSNAAAFATRYYTAGMLIAGVYSGHLDNSGEEITLCDAYGQKVQEFAYSDDALAGWPASADGGGRSLVIVDPTASASTWNLPTSWRASRHDDGTPGADESSLPDSAVVVNEVLSNSGASAGDWVELKNTTDADIDIGGWWLSDSSPTPAKYQIPAHTILPAHGYLTFDEFTSFGQAGLPNAFALNATGDDVVISSATAAGVLTGYRQTVHFEGADLNVTLGRYDKPGGGTDFVPLTIPTPGTDNAPPVVGPVVINELMYDPAPGADEFIELHNITSADVPLYDPSNPGNRWKFTNGVDFTFPAGATLGANAYALVVGIDPATFRSTYHIPAQVQIFGPYTGAINDTAALSNTGETLALSRPAAPQPDNSVPYVQVDSITYSNAAPWPIGANGTGHSIGRITPTAYGNNPANWALENPDGSPGLPNLDNTVPTVSLPDIASQQDLPIDSINITFSEPVSGFDLAHLSLSRNGGANLLGASQSLSSDDNATYTLSGLDLIDWLKGDYTLTLDPAGITDLAGHALSGGAGASWTMSRSALVGTGGDDTFTLAVSGSDLQIWRNVPMYKNTTWTAPLADLSGLFLDSGGGTDTLSVYDPSACAPSGAVTGEGSVTLGGTSILFAGVESLSVGLAGAFTYTTPNASDQITIDSATPGQVTISGNSSGVDLLGVTLFNTDTLILDTGANDTAGSTDTLTITAGGIPAAAVARLRLAAGTGDNALLVNGGDIDLDTNAGSSGGANLDLTVSAGAQVRFATGQVLRNVTVNDGGRATLQLDGGTLQVSSLNLADTGTLDLVNNGLVLSYGENASPQSILQQYVLRGIQTGTGLVASHASIAGFSQSGRVLAVFDNHDAHFTSLNGTDLSPDYNQVLVKYTYLGDANGDGKVDPTDYAVIDGKIGLGNSWITGDLNFDGKVDPSDYAQVDGNQGAGLGGAGGPQLSTVAPAMALPPVRIAKTAKPASNSTSHPRAKHAIKSLRHPLKHHKRKLH